MTQAETLTLDAMLARGAIVAGFRATSKKHLLRELADVAADATGLDARVILAAILEREKLGSTGVGGGIAIPHARLAGLSQVVGVFAQLVEGVDFDAIDEAPADLVFLLLAPDEAGADHLKALARVARAMRRDDLCERLRAAPDAEALTLLLGDSQKTDAA